MKTTNHLKAGRKVWLRAIRKCKNFPEGCKRERVDLVSVNHSNKMLQYVDSKGEQGEAAFSHVEVRK